MRKSAQRATKFAEMPVSGPDAAFEIVCGDFRFENPK